MEHYDDLSFSFRLTLRTLLDADKTLNSTFKRVAITHLDNWDEWAYSVARARQLDRWSFPAKLSLLPLWIYMTVKTDVRSTRLRKKMDKTQETFNEVARAIKETREGNKSK